MARIPCSFSAQEDFLASIDARAEDLGMKRSEYIVHALRLELSRGGAMVISSGHKINQTGDGNTAIGSVTNLPSASDAPARKSVRGAKAKRGKKSL